MASLFPPVFHLSIFSLIYVFSFIRFQISLFVLLPWPVIWIFVFFYFNLSRKFYRILIEVYILINSLFPIYSFFIPIFVTGDVICLAVCPISQHFLSCIFLLNTMNVVCSMNAILLPSHLRTLLHVEIHYYGIS